MLRTFKSYYVEILLFLNNLKSSFTYAQVTSGGTHRRKCNVLASGNSQALGRKEWERDL